MLDVYKLYVDGEEIFTSETLILSAPKVVFLH